MNMRLNVLLQLRLLGLLSVAALLSACGWQLQGAHRVPEYIAPLYLDLVDIHSPFAESLRQRLLQAGIAVTEDRTRAQSVLYVTVDSGNHRVSSVSALNEPQQYEIYYDVAYRLDKLATPAIGTVNSGKAGHVEVTSLLPQQTFNASRTMSFDKTLALAKQREELFLRATLAAELTDQVMRRLSMLPSEPVAAAPEIIVPDAAAR